MKALILTLACAITLSTHAQPDLVDFNYITFNSELEKEVITDHVRKAESNNFMLLMAGGSLLNDEKVRQVKETFYAGLRSLKDEKYEGRKNEKKVKLVYDYLQATYLKKFQHRCAFEEIFISGIYSSLTGSALYALAFDELGIPYAIKEEPSQVYLIAFPDNEQIRIECASSMAGYLTMDDAFKQQYLKALKEQKIISSDEFYSLKTEDLFNKYYYGAKQGISLHNLVGMQYLESAQLKAESTKFDAAFAEAEKAYLFYPVQKTAYSMYITGASAFEGRTRLDSLKALQLGKMSRFVGGGLTSEDIQAEFGNAMNTLLFQQGKQKEAEDFYRVLLQFMENVGVRKEIEFIYHYESGRYLYNKGQYSNALPFFEKSVILKPDAIDATNGLVANLANLCLTSSDNVAKINLLEQSAARIPSLSDNDMFNQLKMTAQLFQVATSFDQGKVSEGEKYRLAFEELRSKAAAAPVDQNLIGEAYARAAVYFFRKGQTAKAKAIIASGLKFAPNNRELLIRKEMIK
jgi:tetratricopeptide (TPR) repeat protein